MTATRQKLRPSPNSGAAFILNYADGGMHPFFQRVLREKGAEVLKSASSDKAPVSRPKEALLAPQEKPAAPANAATPFAAKMPHSPTAAGHRRKNGRSQGFRRKLGVLRCVVFYMTAMGCVMVLLFSSMANAL